MSYLTLLQSNFAQGELSPWLAGRTDIAQYENSASEVKNFIVRAQGGLTKRPGTVYVSPVRDQTASTTILKPFVYSDLDSYVLEFGDQYIRFYRNGAQILSSAAVTNGNFPTDISGWSPSVTGTGTVYWYNVTPSAALSAGTSGTASMTQQLGYFGYSLYTVTFTNSATVTASMGSTAFGTDISTAVYGPGTHSFSFTPTVDTAYLSFANLANNTTVLIDNVSIDSPPYQIATPWTGDQVADIKTIQVFDTIYLVHGSVQPKKLVRQNHARWQLSNVLFTDGPYYDVTDARYGGRGSGITVTPSAATGASITVTASANIFVSTDVGRFIRYQVDATTANGWGIITGYTSGTVVTVSVQSNLGGTTASSLWRLGAWSNTTGFPSCISFFEQRMVLGRTFDQPQTIWFSKSADITRFSPDNDKNLNEVDPNTAMTYTLYSSSKASLIYWIEPQRGLYIGTSEGVFLAKASSTGEALTPANLSITQIVVDSVADTRPLTSGNITLFVQKFRRKIQEVRYSFQDDSFKSPDIALLADHRTVGLVAELVPCRSPNYLVWVRNRDGSLSSITYLPEQNITAWAQHEIGGNGFVESICAVPGAYEDELWMIVQRTINGVTKRYIEYLSQTFLEQDVTASKFVDCNISYSGSPSSTLTGAGHLEGETVQCFGDGATVVVSSPVTGGAVTLQEQVSNAVVGLPYEAVLETNQLSSKTAPASLQGRTTRIHAAVLRMYRSYGGFIGSSTSSMDLIPGYSSNTIMNEPLELFTGDKEYLVPSTFSNNPVLRISHNLPVPFNLLALVTKSSVSER